MYNTVRQGPDHYIDLPAESTKRTPTGHAMPLKLTGLSETCILPDTVRDRHRRQTEEKMVRLH